MMMNEVTINLNMLSTFMEDIVEGTQPGFHFSNSGDNSGTPTDSKKNKPFI